MNTIVEQIRTVSAVGPAVLNNHQIANDEDFWRYLGDGRTGRLTALANELQLTEQRVLEILSTDVLVTCERRHRWTGLGGNILSALVLLIVLAAIWSVYSHPPFVFSSQVVVTDKNGIPPYRLIDKTGVTVSRSLRKAGSFHKIEDVVGRYSTAPLPNRTVLTEKALISKDRVPSGLPQCLCLLVSIPAAAGQLSASIHYPQKVTLLFPVKEKGGTPGIIEDVYLLGAATIGDKTFLQTAIPKEKLASIQSGEVYIVFPIRDASPAQ